MSSRIFQSSELQEIASMRAGEIKQELESYGISTKSFLEKSELVTALEKARAEGLKPKQSTSTNKPKTPSSSSSSSTSSNTLNRQERIKEELDKINDSMKAAEMKKELESMGLSTKSFFEKSEFAKALAEARVDGVKKEEEVEVEVEVLGAGDPGPQKRSEQQQQQQSRSSGSQATNPFGAAGSPFSQARSNSPFGNAGGMGNIADILKNMGGGGGAAPGGFGGFDMNDILKNMGAGAGAGAGAGGFPGGMGGMPDMGKMQELMKNPKVAAAISKAQSNPKIMAALSECMSNPAAFAKYQNDPDIAELLNEIKPYL